MFNDRSEMDPKDWISDKATMTYSASQGPGGPMKRNSYSHEFKAKVSLRGEKVISDLQFAEI
jgi:hypothetical protein